MMRERNQEWLQNLIIEEDKKIAFINKPRGIPVQGGTRIKFSLDDILRKLDNPWHIVHRLDRETTGLMIFAKYADVAQKICAKFKNHEINKTYYAMVHGQILEKEFIINEPLLETRIGNENLMIVDKNQNNEKSKFAITEVKMLEYYADYDQSILKLYPKTGRKNQLRAHLNFIGHPIVGDCKYNFQEKKRTKLMLHARSLKFSLGQKNYDVMAELPDFWPFFL